MEVCVVPHTQIYIPVFMDSMWYYYFYLPLSIRYTLSTSNVAVASLLCAFFPVFPATSSDNRYHLQAMRHLYVLAAQPGVLIARDQDTGRAHPVQVVVKSVTGGGKERLSTTPCLVQSWDEIESVEVVDERYWPFTVGPMPAVGRCNPLRWVCHVHFHMHVLIWYMVNILVELSG